MPSWISRASRCRSSVVASERTSSKSSAASSRSAAGVGHAGDPADHRRRVRAGDVRLERRPARPCARPATSGTTSAETSPPRVRPGLRPVGDLRLLAGPGVGDGRVGVERGLPVDPVRRRSGRARPAGRRRWPTAPRARSTGGDRAHLLEQVLGDAARVQGGARAAGGRRCAAGSAAGSPRRTAAAPASRRWTEPALHGVHDDRGQPDDGQPLARSTAGSVGSSSDAVGRARPGRAAPAATPTSAIDSRSRPAERGQDHRHGQVGQEGARPTAPAWRSAASACSRRGR